MKKLVLIFISLFISLNSFGESYLCSALKGDISDSDISDISWDDQYNLTRHNDLHFIMEIIVPLNEMSEYVDYKIIALGDTNFNLIGADSSPAVGEIFTKNRILGIGTGLVVEISWDEMLFEIAFENNDSIRLELVFLEDYSTLQREDSDKVIEMSIGALSINNYTSEVGVMAWAQLWFDKNTKEYMYQLSEAEVLYAPRLIQIDDENNYIKFDSDWDGTNKTNELVFYSDFQVVEYGTCIDSFNS
tara:strand:- start:87 stop:824 length:738 start_codon:yes stop_codon:yes gene_type:complete